MTPKEINALSTRLQVGDRFYYTGDMANSASFGTVTKRIEDPKWGLRYDVEFDEERFEGDEMKNKKMIITSIASILWLLIAALVVSSSFRRALIAFLIATGCAYSPADEYAIDHTEHDWYDDNDSGFEVIEYDTGIDSSFNSESGQGHIPKDSIRGNKSINNKHNSDINTDIDSNTNNSTESDSSLDPDV